MLQFALRQRRDRLWNASGRLHMLQHAAPVWAEDDLAVLSPKSGTHTELGFT
jgi:hypothetical protein